MRDAQSTGNRDDADDRHAIDDWLTVYLSTRRKATEVYSAADAAGYSKDQAKKAHETLIATYLAENVDDRIERRTRNGGKDRGDLSGIRLSPALGGGRVVAELKNTAKIALSSWQAEAEIERGNDNTAVALVIHKRHGVGDPGRQWVTCTVDDQDHLLARVLAT
jgi:hypothetical protein